jgi:hypothetical protein
MRRLGLLSDDEKTKSAEFIDAVDLDGNGKVRARHTGCCAAEQQRRRRRLASCRLLLCEARGGQFEPVQPAQSAELHAIPPAD